MHSLLQTQEWADLKVSQGWQSHNVDGIFVLEKKLPFGKTFLYAPEVTFSDIKSHPEASAEGSPTNVGSETSSEILRSAQNDNFDNFLQNLQKISENRQAIFLRVEILDEFDGNIIANLKQNGFIKAFEELQPEWRQIIDITKSEEEILAQMRQKGRYNIKIAQRENVVIKKSENINDYYKIFVETAKRDGFSIRPRKYFEDLLQKMGQNAELLVADFQGKIIAAAIITYYQETASYLYGASSNEFRNVMAPYLLHWEAMEKAKEKGCKYYDLLAVEPQTDYRLPVTEKKEDKNAVVSSQSAVSNHKYAGITRFKEQFGGRKVHIVGSWDLVHKPVWYKIFRLFEKIRR